MAKKFLLFAFFVSLIATFVVARDDDDPSPSTAPAPVSASARAMLVPNSSPDRSSPIQMATADTSSVDRPVEIVGDFPAVESDSSQTGNVVSSVRQANPRTESSEVAAQFRDGSFQPDIERAMRNVFESSRVLSQLLVQPSSFRGMMGEMISGAAVVTPPRSDARNLPSAEIHRAYCERLIESGDPGSFDVAIAGGFVPKGLVLNKGTGQLCGTPVESGIFRFILALRDFSGRREQLAYRLVVNEPAAVDDGAELSIVSEDLAVGAVGAEYVFPLAAAGGAAPYAWSASGLPSGLELDSASGLLGGSPADAGEFDVSVSVVDREGRAATKSFTLIIRTTPVFITTSSFEEGTVGELFQARLAAQGGVPPYVWELSGTELPKGLTLNAVSGTLEGSPEAAFEGVISFRVIDVEQATDIAEVPLVIHASSLRIISNAVPDGFVDEPYSFLLRADGGTPPYVWSVVGDLPGGLSIRPDGVLSGSVNEEGDFTLLISVSDSLNASAKRTLRLRIEAVESAEPTATPLTSPVPTPLPEPDDGGSALETPTPRPTLPPVESFDAVPSDRKVGLSWVNPNHVQFVQTVVVRGKGIAPVTTAEGVLVYAGTDTQVLDTGLENSETYVYSAFAEYSGDATDDTPDPRIATARPDSIRIDSSPDAFIDRVRGFSPLDPNCFNCPVSGSIVLGPPRGLGEYGGSLDGVSIGARVNGDSGRSGPYGGSIVVEFTDNIVVDGPGPDFVIFENALRLLGTDDYFIEPATVDVSADGVHFFRFRTDFVPHYRADGSLNLWNPFAYATGFAGVRPVYSNQNVPSPLKPSLAGGDAFNLSDLPGAPLRWIRFVRITSTGDGWITDGDGDVIRHSNSNPTWGASGHGNSGFDLDAVAAVNY